MPGAGQADYQASVFYKWTQRLEEEKTIVGEAQKKSQCQMMKVLFLSPRQANLAGQLVYVWRVWRWV